MSNLANRIEKLESKIGTKEEVILIHRVIRDMPNDARGEPTHYLVNGKLYKNDDTINEAVRADLGDVGENCIQTLWEPIYAEA